MYWAGHFAESAFVIGSAILLMYYPLFVRQNDKGTSFVQYASSSVLMALLALFGVLTIVHAMLLSVFLWSGEDLSSCTNLH